MALSQTHRSQSFLDDSAAWSSCLGFVVIEISSSGCWGSISTGAASHSEGVITSAYMIMIEPVSISHEGLHPAALHHPGAHRANQRASHAAQKSRSPAAWCSKVSIGCAFANSSYAVPAGIWILFNASPAFHRSLPASCTAYSICVSCKLSSAIQRLAASSSSFRHRRWSSSGLNSRTRPALLLWLLHR